jgi:hypothetical protein
VFPDTSNGYEVDMLFPTPVAPVRLLLPPLSVAVPDVVREVVTVVVLKLAVPDVCVRLPPIVKLISVPTDVRELEVTPFPSVELLTT